MIQCDNVPALLVRILQLAYRWEVLALPERFVVVGGGLAAISAVQGIRELDSDAPITVLSKEKDLPYHRPPLSKKLWFGKAQIEEIFIQDEKYYREKRVELKSGVEVIGIDTTGKKVLCADGQSYRFDKLLLATGGTPRTLKIPGGNLPGICYFRTLEDYRKLKSEIVAHSGNKTALVVGGGFIGSEMAAALTLNQVQVTMIFPEPYLVQRVFPEYLGRAIQDQYKNRGVRIFPLDVPVSFERRNGEFVTQTRSGLRIRSDIILVGAGIQPSTELAEEAGIQVSNGILINSFLQTSHPEIYAAGDNANFPYIALGKQMRVEHWDHALNQGKQAGRNMAGAAEIYSYMPYFFSDLFEFGYEAVGEVDSKLDTQSDWQKENDTGVIYYLRNGKVRGAMMCNVWNKVEWARELIREGRRIEPGHFPKVA